MDYIDITAAALGLSRTTVIRTLKHSEKVNTKTKNMVVDYIFSNFPSKIECFKKLNNDTKTAKKRINIIMPFKPRFFWDKAIEGIRKGMESATTDDYELKFIFYSEYLNESDILNTLNEVNFETTDALAIVPINSAKISARINELSAKIPVVLFNEFCDNTENVISIIGNSYDEGFSVGELAGGCLKENDKILILDLNRYNSGNNHKRIKGFEDSINLCESRIECIYLSVDMNDRLDGATTFIDESLLPSFIARNIAKILEEDDKIKAVYIPDGLMYQLLVALRKIGRKDIKAFGHEYNPRAIEMLAEGYKGGFIAQDIKTQGEIAVKKLIEHVGSGTTIGKEETIYTKFEEYSYN